MGASPWPCRKPITGLSVTDNFWWPCWAHTHGSTRLNERNDFFFIAKKWLRPWSLLLFHLVILSRTLIWSGWMPAFTASCSMLRFHWDSRTHKPLCHWHGWHIQSTFWNDWRMVEYWGGRFFVKYALMVTGLSKSSRISCVASLMCIHRLR